MNQELVLQKLLQRAGIGSKRHVRRLIRDGRVSIDGIPCTRYAESVDPSACVTAAGEVVDLSSLALTGERIVLVMNKPKKHLTAVEDSEQGPGLGQYLPDLESHVFPVGRLDFNSEGLLLWTNDGTLARRILHPDWSVAKKYAVKIRGHFDATHPGLRAMEAGMQVGKTRYKPVDVSLGEKRTRATWVGLVLREGKNRQIRKMCAASGFQIVKLRRVAIGPVELGDLNPRCVRAATEEEVTALLDAVGL